MEDEALRRIRQVAADAREGDDMVGNGWDMPFEPAASSLDDETLDEQASTQMGDTWESRRRDAS